MLNRCVLMVLDGLGDRSYSSLDHKTPLECAYTPNLDALAALGSNGLFHADRLGVPLSSQDAHFSLYGYDRDEIPRRGILEAVGSGTEVGPRDVAILARLVTAEEKQGILNIVDRKPKAEPQEIAELFDAVKQYRSGTVEFRYTQVNRLEGILVSPAMCPSTSPTPILCAMAFPLPC